MENIRMAIQYDGSGFYGYQKQPGKRTVQGVLEEILERLFNSPVKVIGAGRTDAGVHARGQVVNFRCSTAVPVDHLEDAVNVQLPPDIRVVAAEAVSLDFHSRYDARSRLYSYRILNRDEPDAMNWRFLWHVRSEICDSALQEALDLFPGNRDFGFFGRAEQGMSTCRDVLQAEYERQGQEIIILLRANAFLRHMARALVGACVDVATGKRNPLEIKEALIQRQTRVFTCAPPNGLVLEEVEY